MGGGHQQFLRKSQNANNDQLPPFPGEFYEQRTAQTDAAAAGLDILKGMPAFMNQQQPDHDQLPPFPGELYKQRTTHAPIDPALEDLELNHSFLKETSTFMERQEAEIMERRAGETTELDAQLSKLSGLGTEIPDFDALLERQQQSSQMEIPLERQTFLDIQLANLNSIDKSIVDHAALQNMRWRQMANTPAAVKQDAETKLLAKRLQSLHEKETNAAMREEMDELELLTGIEAMRGGEEKTKPAPTLEDMQRAYHKVFKSKNDKLLAEQYKEAMGDELEDLERQDAEFKRLQKEEESARKQREKAAAARAKAERAVVEKKEKLRKKALRADRMKIYTDKVRHGFYGFIKGFVEIGRTITGARAEAENSTEDSTHEVNIQDATRRLEELRRQYEAEGRQGEFNQKYGIAERDLRIQAGLKKATLRVQHPNETEEQIEERMQSATMQAKFLARENANVVGGTKPNSVRYLADGSKWLVKESRSCIGVEEPNAAIVTEAGYRVQQLVHPDTAIEAFKGKSAGLGTVSYQRMVQNLVTDHVDLFQFSRTPESMTEADLKKVEALAPQILKEHTTDWLLYNFDTKGENFILSREPNGNLKLYGIDKEAGFRAVLDKGAQKMSKDYQRFDQDTVYNQLFRKFADGSMDFDLKAVEAQIQCVEAMSDEEYMKIFDAYMDQQKRDRPDDVLQIKNNILQRKRSLRAEYREFFGNLVRERMQNVSKEEAEVLKQKYFAGSDDGVFLFDGDTQESLKAERARKLEDRSLNHDELEKKAREADAKDEIKYKIRHGFYDFSKGFVMGLKGLLPTGDVDEIRETTVPVQTLKRDATEEELQSGVATLNMERNEQVALGGTKPMSKYIADDESEWLAKQAVNCMGYYKIEGALLTEAGSKLQKVVHPETAVDAFVGRTRMHGDVSFQRLLEDVEKGEDKLDLFKFSKHPELADAKTIREVQELAPQILREHTTDWLLCNFDTKGENFIITKKGDGPRVLYGIDKEASFNKILKPGAQHMSRAYKPHANNTLYNVIFTMYANGEMDLDLFDVMPQIQKVSQMSDAKYIMMFIEYLAFMKEEDPKNYDQVFENILKRKNNLQKEYEDFFTTLVEERCKKLHPEEARALRTRYYGEGGNHFRFPENPPENPAENPPEQ